MIAGEGPAPQAAHRTGAQERRLRAGPHNSGGDLRGRAGPQPAASLPVATRSCPVPSPVLCHGRWVAQPDGSADPAGVGRVAGTRPAGGVAQVSVEGRRLGARLEGCRLVAATLGVGLAGCSAHRFHPPLHTDSRVLVPSPDWSGSLLRRSTPVVPTRPPFALLAGLPARPMGGPRASPTGPSRRWPVPVGHLRLRIDPGRRSAERPGIPAVRPTRLGPVVDESRATQGRTNAGIGISGNWGRL
jgi:hypothetical protein